MPSAARCPLHRHLYSSPQAPRARLLFVNQIRPPEVYGIAEERSAFGGPAGEDGDAVLETVQCCVVTRGPQPAGACVSGIILTLILITKPSTLISTLNLQVHASAEHIRLVTFDADGTLYADGAHMAQDNRMIQVCPIFRRFVDELCSISHPSLSGHGGSYI